METTSPKEGGLGKYWIKPAMTVEHIASGLQMFVDRIERKRHKTKIDKKTGKLMVRTLGVRCRWVDADGKPQRKLFHTKELRPCQKN